MHLLDPRFRYVPANATDITTTWQRFGFDSRRNEERRARLKQRLAGEAPDARAEAPAIRTLASIKTRR
jgi:hypothetical protein